MFTVYILKSVNTCKSYVGVTSNMVRRFKEHNAGRHTYTKRYIPWKIINSEEFDDFISARKREKYYKTAAGRIALKKIFEALQ